MENVEDNKKGKLMKLLVLAGIIAATLGGCVISLNIQKNNNNSDQKVDQNASANQENDSTSFNIKRINMETVVKEDEKEPKLNQNENDYTEQYKWLIMLRKGKLEEREIWFATVGQMLVSDGAFETKEELINNMENLTHRE